MRRWLIPFRGWIVFDLTRAALYLSLASRLLVDKDSPWTLFLLFRFLYFSRSMIKRWKDLFTVWRAAARRWRCKRQTARRCHVSCLPFLSPFVELFFKIRVCSLFFLPFMRVACSWAPPHIRGPSSEHSSKQRFLRWNYVSTWGFFVVVFF